MPDRPPSPALPADDSPLPPAQCLYSSPVCLPEGYWYAYTCPASACDDGHASDLASRMGAIQVDDDADPSSAEHQMIPEYPTPAMRRRMGMACVFRVVRQRRSYRFPRRRKDHNGNSEPEPEPGVEMEMDGGRGADAAKEELERRRQAKRRKHERREKRKEMHQRAAESGRVFVPPPPSQPPDERRSQ